MYVDILAQSVTEVQFMIDDIAARSLATRLKISQSKTNSMRTSGLDETPITLNSIPIEKVQNFKYLGCLINPKGEAVKEIQSRSPQPGQHSFGFGSVSGYEMKSPFEQSSGYITLWSSLCFFMVAKRGPSELGKLIT